MADSGSPDTSEASLTPDSRGGSTAVDVPPKYGGEWAEFLRTHNHEEIMERLKHVQLGDRTKYRYRVTILVGENFLLTSCRQHRQLLDHCSCLLPRQDGGTSQISVNGRF